MELHQHPLSAAFPAMSDDEYSALVDDIRTHGQRDVATLADGMVIDGWHRYKACVEIGIPCRIEELVCDDAIAFVRSKNQHRRHYQKSQQAAIEVSLTEWAASHRPNKGEAASPLSTNKEMADRAGTTTRTIQHAKRAHEAGLGDVVRDGKISAEQAAEIAKNPDLAKQVGRGEKTLPQAVEELTGKRPGAKLPKQEEVSDDLAGLREANTEQGQTIKELLAENEAMAITLEADDKLAAVMAENKKIKEMNRILEERVRGLQGEVNAAKRAAQSWQRKADKFEKLLIGKAD